LEVLLEREFSAKIFLKTEKKKFSRFGILQAALARATGALEDTRCDDLGHEAKMTIEVNMTVMGTLCAHVNGFACINTFAGVQQLPVFASSPLGTVFVMPICFGVIWLIFAVRGMTNILRNEKICSRKKNEL
jgi:hypothetical protein